MKQQDMHDSIPGWINKLALDIYRLIQKHNVMTRFSEMANRWAEDLLIGNEKLKAWRKERTTYFEEKVLNDSCLRDETKGPPKTGWCFEKHVYQAEKQTESGIKLVPEIIAGWVPPELSYSTQPQVTLPLPLGREHPLDMVEQYAVLGAIYEYGRRGTEKLSVAEWPDDWETPGAYSNAMKSMSFYGLSQYVSRLNQNDEGWLRAMLDDVKDDVSKWAAAKAPTFKNLLQRIESSESAYRKNISVAEKYESQSSPEGHWWRVQANVLHSKPNPEEWPGVDALEAICQSRFGSGLTGENLSRIRGELIISQDVGPADVDSMTIKEVVAKHRNGIVQRERESIAKDKARVHIGSVRGDVTISQDQSGGTTAHTIKTGEEKKPRKFRWLRIVIPLLASIATILAYLGIRPALNDSELNGDGKASIVETNEDVIGAVGTSVQITAQSPGSLEVIDLIKLLLAEKRVSKNWSTGAHPGTPISWISEGKDNDPPENIGDSFGHLSRHGLVILTLKGKPVYKVLKKVVEPGTWDIWLIGPRAGVYLAKIESTSYGPELPIDVCEILQNSRLKVNLYKGVNIRGTTANFIIYLIEGRDGEKTWLAESWSAGTRGGTQDFWITYSSEYADELWDKFGRWGKQHVLDQQRIESYGEGE